MIQTAIKKVLIVGGGSSGWMTASYLARTFKKQVEIALVESANIRTIGVGEATFSTLKLFFDHLGLQEADWMPHCSGSYKLAIKFANWTKKKGHFYHPFERYRKTSGFDAGKWWLKLKRHEAFDYACFSTPYLCDAMRSPRFLDGRVYDSKVHAYYPEQGRAAQYQDFRARGPVSVWLPFQRVGAGRIPSGLRRRTRRHARARRRGRGTSLR